MSREERAWLDGYRLATRELHAIREEKGWAGGKGEVKRWLRGWRETFPYWADGMASNGFVAACLDAVGC